MALSRISLTTLLVFCTVCSIHSASATEEEYWDPRDTSPPEITRNPSPTRGYDILILDKQIPLRLQCDAEGKPPPTYKWIKYDLDGGNPVELDENDPRITITDGDLEIANSEEQQEEVAGLAEGETFIIDKDDEGMYQCIAENTFGSALSKKIKAQLAYIDPFQWVEPITVNARIGEKVVLDCNPPEGVPNPRLSIYWSWGRPGEPIKNPVIHDKRVILDGNGNLVFANAQEVDDRNYICIAPNHYIREARNSPIISLVVDTNNPAPQRAPSWVYKPPSSLEVLRTKKLELICAAEGNPTPDITWSWEDTIDLENRVDYGDGNTKMTVWDVTFDDAGRYTCRATNTGGRTTIEYTTIVTVRSAPYWHPSAPEAKTIAPTESVSITCQAGGSPAPMITWLINGQDPDTVDANPRRIIESGQASGHISIQNAQESDSAVFQCIATNKYGEEITSVFLNVLAIPAEIQTRPDPSYEKAEGDDVELACKPFGAPHPKVVWLFNGNELRGEGGKYAISTGGSNEGMLTIFGLTMEDKGDYTCNVSNSFGVDVAKPRVIVRMQTEILEGPGEKSVKEGDNAVLPCQIQSDEELELTVKWIKNEEGTDEGREIDFEVESNRYRLGSDNSLTIIMTKKVDDGEYTCKAITTFSEDSASGQLTILSAPDKPFNVAVASHNNLDVTLEWTPGSDGNSEILEYTVEGKTEFPDLGWSEMETVSAASTSTTLTLKPYNTYNFRVKATNAVGQSQPSELSESHTTPARKPTVIPSDIKGTGPDTGLMVVEWKKIHQSDYAGPDFKYIVRYRVKGTSKWEEVPVTPDEDLRVEVTGDQDFQMYDIQVITENAEGRSETEPETVEGISGESVPDAAPGDVNVDVIDSSSARVSWTPVPAESINGIALGYKVYTTIVIASGSEEPHVCQESPCVVENLQAFSDYSLQVAVYNGKGTGPKSDPITFDTPQGPPSVVLNLEARSTSDRILVTWDKPATHNGVLQGYNLTSALMLGNQVQQRRTEKIDKPDQTRFLLDENLEPEHKYRITVAAMTGGGEGQQAVTETRTKPQGVPPAPLMNFDDVGPYSMNISLKEQPANVAAADFISIKYHKKSEDESDAKTTDSVDLFDQEQVYVKDLQPNTVYMLQMVAKNSHGEGIGKWEEQKTKGPAGVSGGGFKVEGWFVALIVIIILLLLILLIICVLKSQKGGKYNVSDKEQQLKGDIESAPLKDEGGFEEFQPGDNTDEGAPLTSGSHPSLNESEAGSSETDSLKEYAEGDTGKFNEEGSFIGQYGDRKTRPPEEGQDGAAYSTFV